MCKQKGNLFCSELGSDIQKWSIETPLPRPNDFKNTWEKFKFALIHESQGDFDRAQSSLANDRGDSLRIWFDEDAQNAGEWRRKAFGIPGPTPAGELDPNKNFAKFLIPILTRDNFRCRYCSSTVFPRRRFKDIHSSLGDKLFPLGRKNSEMSGFYLTSCATLDHVIPHSLGGRTNEENLVTACWPCNYGKMNYTLEQIGLENPLLRPPLPMELPIEILMGNSR